jgi:hypothetical protein
MASPKRRLIAMRSIISSIRTSAGRATSVSRVVVTRW